MGLVKELKKAGDYERALRLQAQGKAMQMECDAKNWAYAPGQIEALAIICRKLKRYDLEIAACDEGARNFRQRGLDGSSFEKRAAKARGLMSKTLSGR